MKYLSKLFSYCHQISKAGSVFCLCLLSVFSGSSQEMTITATNKMSVGRLNQIIELSADQLSTFAAIDFNKIHVVDDAGRELIVQAIDTDGDHRSDKIIFQSDFGSHQTRTFRLYAGDEHLYKATDYKTYGRFVRERFDDFAWENDRIGQRVYGPALKTTDFGPLTSSAVDIWPKKTSRLIINNWYMTDHYHIDTGEGADLYVSGKTRGVGGDGIWHEGKLLVSENFSASEVRTVGPLRISFDLTYESFSSGNLKIVEQKNIALDAGQNLNHFTVKYQVNSPTELLAAAGIQISTLPADEIRKGLNPYHNKVSIERKPGAIIEKAENKAAGWIAIRQPVSVGELYTAIIVAPEQFVETKEDGDNFLVITRLPASKTFSYWAGYGWSESGQFADFEEWKHYVSDFAAGLRSPIQVEIRR